jgi:tRNA A37 N6-isopentenylltransferase MiaA
MAEVIVSREDELEYQDYESLDVEKKKDSLKRSADRLKTVIDAQVDELKENAVAWGKAIAIVGGSVYFTYKIIKRIIKSSRQSKYERRLVSKISNARNTDRGYGRALPVLTKSNKGWSLNNIVRQQLMLLAVAIAKRKIISLIGK